MRVLGCSVILCAIVANAQLLDGKTLNNIDAALTADCGSNCVNMWHQMLKNDVPSEITKITDAISFLEQKHVSLLKEIDGKIGAVQSFLQWSPLETPCGSPASCAVVAQAANACNFGRILTSTTYQLLNIQAHVIAVAASVACGCVHAANVSRCALAKMYTFCEITNTWRQSLLSASQSSWEAVKGMTKKCQLRGDPRVMR